MRQTVQVVLALVLFAAAAALFSLPAAYHLRDAAVGAPESPVFYDLWLAWAVPHTVGAGDLSLSHSMLIHDPAGTDLWRRAGDFLPQVALAPVTARFGPVAASNLLVILLLFLNAAAAYLFLMFTVGDAGAAVPAAAAFGLGTYVLHAFDLAGPAVGGVFVVPLAAYAIVRACDAPSIRLAAYAYLSILLAAWWNGAYGFGVWLFGWFAVVHAVRTDKTARPLYIVGPALLLAGFGLYATSDYFTAQVAGGRALGPGADVLEPFYASRAYADTVPYFLLIAAVGALASARRRALAFWWLAALAFFALAWGPTIHIWGWDTGVPGPYRLTTLFGRTAPTGFLVLAALCLAVPAGFGVRSLLEQLDSEGGRGERRLVSIVTLLALAVSFFFTPRAAVSAAAPQPYGALHEHGSGAVWELPPNEDWRVNARYLYYQTQHEHPALVGGAWPGAPACYPTLILDASPPLRDLCPASFDPEAFVESDAARFVTFLRRLRVAYVALHPLDAGAAGPLLRQWCEAAFGPPVRADASVEIYLVR